MKSKLKDSSVRLLLYEFFILICLVASTLITNNMGSSVMSMLPGLFFLLFMYPLVR